MFKRRSDLGKVMMVNKHMEMLEMQHSLYNKKA